MTKRTGASGSSLSSNVCFESALKAHRPKRTRKNDYSRVDGHVLRVVRSITCARVARWAAGLSLAQMCARVVASTERTKIDRSTLANMESARRRVYVRKHDARRFDRYPMSEDVRQVYSDALVEAVRVVTGDQLRIAIDFGARRWTVEPLIGCVVCGDWFTPKDGRSKRCKWCIAHRQTKKRIE